jgi:pyruvate ferredoxin oxidoreductase gamma subunit/2-oxoisovalerate ferredoxin oxidoreductase gamma subunit
MLEIRIHGRGGQGAVIAAKILAVAAARERLFVQAFPEFGVERRGAPVCAYVRVSQSRIYERGQIRSPGHLLILDRTLLECLDITWGLKRNGWIIMNSQQPPEAYKEEFANFRTATVDGNSIALSYRLGSKFAPFVNSTMLGAFARAVPFIRRETLLDTIRASVPAKKEENAQAALQAYHEVLLAAQVEEVWAHR